VKKVSGWSPKSCDSPEIASPSWQNMFIHEIVWNKLHSDFPVAHSSGSI
jgi:hypothetical protein